VSRESRFVCTTYCEQQRVIWLGTAIRDVKAERWQLVPVGKRAQKSKAPISIDVVVSTDEGTG
jgi:hypothetical protein